MADSDMGNIVIKLPMPSRFLPWATTSVSSIPT